MISATEARELYDASGKDVENWINCKVRTQVESSAKSGNWFVYIPIDSIESYAPLPNPTNLEQAVMSKLISLGYVVKLMKYGGTYIPRGLSDDNGDGPTYINYGLCVGW